MLVVVTVDVVVVTGTVGDLPGVETGEETGGVGGLPTQFPLWQQFPQYGELVPQ